MLKLIVMFSMLGFLISCASKPVSDTPADNNTAASIETKGDIDHFHLNEEPKDVPVTTGSQKIEELEIIPTEINSSVEKWIAYFQGRGRPHMEKYLLRSTRYEALMKKVDLVYLVD